MPSLTNYGQQVGLINDDRALLALNGAATNNGGIATIAGVIHLYDNTTVVAKTPFAFQTPLGGGYAGGFSITSVNWTASVPAGDAQIVLANQTYTATGNPMNNVDGALLVDNDTDDNVLAYWERSTAITLATNDTITADTLTIRLI